MIPKTIRQLTLLTVLILGAMALATGCARTHQARGATPSGFLGDYSKLHEGGSGEAQLQYINPNTDFRRYTKVMIDPVTLWAPPKTKLTKLSIKDAENLKFHLQESMRTQLSQAFPIVNQAGPDTMRIRLGITEAHKSRPVMDFISNILPIGWVLSGTQRLLFGTHSFVGKASLEGEVLDSVTNERLLAAVDRRAGRKVLRGKFSSWDDVKSAQDTWAEQIKNRLTGLCRGTGGNR